MRHRSPLAAGVATRSLKSTAPDTAPGARSPSVPSAGEKSNDAPIPRLELVAFTMVTTSSGRMYPLRTSMVSPTLVRVATMGGKSVSAVVFRMRTGTTSSRFPASNRLGSRTMPTGRVTVSVAATVGAPERSSIRAV